MKMKAVISFLVIVVATILYSFGICEWDLWIYIACIAVVILAMIVFTIQEKQYQTLRDKKKSKH